MQDHMLLDRGMGGGQGGGQGQPGQGRDVP